MPRIYIQLPLATGQIITLPETAVRHLVQVLRMQPGETFIVFNGQGGEYAATLESAGKREASARIGAFNNVSRESPLHVTLAQCVSKGERMDYTLQKAVELGVTEIVPLLSSRSVVRLDGERWEKKMEHWRGVIISACEQSGRTQVPVLHAIAELSHWLPLNSKDALKLTLAPEVRGGLKDLRHRGEPVVLLIGPEGGLSSAEIALAGGHGFRSIRLGPRVLRTETAGVVCLAHMQVLWGDLC